MLRATTGDDECSTSAANNVVPHPTIVRPGPAREPASDDRARENDLDDAGVVIAPGAELGSEVSVRRPGSGVVVAARMFSLRGYRTDPDMDADVWRRSEVLRDLNQYTLSLHEHGERLGLAPLTSRDARVGQCSLGTLFATILRDECRADVCLYNSGGIRGNASYGSEPLTYGDLVAEVPFENNIITLEMTGDEVRDAIAFSEAEQIRKEPRGRQLGRVPSVGRGRRRAPETPRRARRRRLERGRERERGRGRRLRVERRDDSRSRVRTRPGVSCGGVGRVSSAAPTTSRSFATSVDASPQISEPNPTETERNTRRGPEAAAPAICGSDGIPFKILVMRHLARRRWSEILSGASFDDLDTNGDGKLQTEEVAAALRSRTASASPQQEAEAMVRSFDADGDGALTAEDASEIVEHFGGEDERDTWRRARRRGGRSGRRWRRRRRRRARRGSWVDASPRRRRRAGRRSKRACGKKTTRERGGGPSARGEKTTRERDGTGKTKNRTSRTSRTARASRLETSRTCTNSRGIGGERASARVAATLANPSLLDVYCNFHHLIARARAATRRFASSRDDSRRLFFSSRALTVVAVVPSPSALHRPPPTPPPDCSP